MRLPLYLAATCFLPACGSTVPAYPNANDIDWAQPTRSREVQSLNLRDGARIEYVRPDAGFDALTSTGGATIRCIDASGIARWTLTQPTPQPAPSAAANPLASAFLSDPDEPLGPVTLAWEDAALAADDARLYVVQFHHLMNGASVVALDLRNGTIAWSSHVQGIGRVPHSRYSNAVEARIIDGALVIFGDEAAGDYIEVFSPHGEMMSTRVVGGR